MKVPLYQHLLKHSSLFCFLFSTSFSNYFNYLSQLTLLFFGMQCKSQPEPALYNGGILRYGDSGDEVPFSYQTSETGVYSPAFVVYGLNQSTKYTFSCKSIKINFFHFVKVWKRFNYLNYYCSKIKELEHC